MNSGAGGHTDSFVIDPKISTRVLLLGLGALAFVPIFKVVTHLPPYMGILFGGSVLWIFTELLHHNKEWHVKKHLMVVGGVSRVDMSSILFFLDQAWQQQGI